MNEAPPITDSMFYALLLPHIVRCARLGHFSAEELAPIAETIKWYMRQPPRYPRLQQVLFDEHSILNLDTYRLGAVAASTWRVFEFLLSADKDSMAKGMSPYKASCVHCIRDISAREYRVGDLLRAYGISGSSPIIPHPECTHLENGDCCRCRWVISRRAGIDDKTHQMVLDVMKKYGIRRKSIHDSPASALMSCVSAS